jgi:hypothetical protein
VQLFRKSWMPLKPLFIYIIRSFHTKAKRRSESKKFDGSFFALWQGGELDNDNYAWKGNVSLVYAILGNFKKAYQVGGDRFSRCNELCTLKALRKQTHMLTVSLESSVRVATRKLASYACIRWSRGKPWWRPVAILTCKSFVKCGYRGERPIEPASSWFPFKYSSE